MISTNSYMFRHQNAIFRESTNAKDYLQRIYEHKGSHLWSLVFVDSLKTALRCRNM